LGNGLDAHGQHRDLGARWKGILEAAGFVDVSEVVVPFIFGPWPADPKYKQVGRLIAGELSGEGLLGTAMKMLPAGGVPVDDVKTICEGATRDMMEGKVHGYADFHVVCGRKPTYA
jgi:hypothetical protein